MELALGLPMRQWYDDGPEALARLGKEPPLTTTTTSDPRRAASYWPLDYPPLSGYQSWLTGLVVRRAEPAAVALGLASRGHESPLGKSAMRLTVLLCDALVFFPAAAWMARAVAAAAAAAKAGKRRGNTSAAAQAATITTRRRAALAVLLLNPSLVLIDHGHFQYNCISLGLALAAMAALLLEEGEQEQQRGAGVAPPPPPLLLPRGRLVAAVLFTLSLCHKQMGLYYAPAFFAHILGGCLRDHQSSGGPPRQLAAVAAVGCTVLATLSAALMPVVWGHREGFVGGVLAVLRRIFPMGRGLYEDYVANFWCATSVGPVKWKEVLGGGGGSAAPRVALAATLLALLPSVAQQVASPSPLGFLLCCSNSAAAFFLFSFQVHEKSVLLPLMPATLLVFFVGGTGSGGGGLGGVGGGNRRSSGSGSSSGISSGISITSTTTTTSRVLASIALYGPLVACFGMFPLLERDGVGAAYAACLVAYVAVVGGLLEQAGLEDCKEEANNKAKKKAREQRPWSGSGGVFAVALSVAGALHAARLAFEPPARLPWLHDRLFITYAFLFIASATAYLNWLQWGRAAWQVAAARFGVVVASSSGGGGGGGGSSRRRSRRAAFAPPASGERRRGPRVDYEDDYYDEDDSDLHGVDAMPDRFRAAAVAAWARRSFSG
jgi:alpha-1,3-glucosyltransferase